MAPLRFALAKKGPPPSNQPGSTRRAPPPTTSAATSAEQDGRMTEFSSLDDVCPVCRTDRYLQPKLNLLVSFCYHKMCESCIDRIFSLGPSPCPTCGLTVRKHQFKPQLFENLAVQKELAVRRRTAKIFNKREEDFTGENKDKDWNRYLEECEDITFKLLNSLDPVETEAAIKKYEQQNRQQIELNQYLEEESKLSLIQAEEEEKKRKIEAREVYEKLDAAEREARERGKREVLEGLATSDIDASQILSQARQSALSSLPSLSSLFASVSPALPAATTTLANLNPLANPTESLSWFDSYEDLFDIKLDESRGETTTGGWREVECWEKAVREGVAGLWCGIIGEEDEEMVEE